MVEILEAIWLRNGKEVAGVDPVIRVDVEENYLDAIVFNGNCYYRRGDGYIPEDADDFIIRVLKDRGNKNNYARLIWNRILQRIFDTSG